MSDILQRLIKNELTGEEKLGVSDYNRRYYTDDQEPLQPIAVSFSLNKEQKISIYQDVKQRITDKVSPDYIALSVVGLIEDYLKEKQEEAYPGAYGAEKELVNPLTGNKSNFKRV